MDPIKIGVGLTTRRRLGLLARALDSMGRMELPAGADVVFLIAENDDQVSADQVVADFAQRYGVAVEFAHEPEPGIPFARNKVLDMARAQGCDFLTFVDDDEEVTQGWLVALIRAMQQRDLDLAGGPVHLLPPDEPLGWAGKGMFSVLLERAVKRNRRRAGRAERDQDGAERIYTNNWCARLATLEKLDLRFNEAMRYTGGTDTRFSLDLEAAGGRIGWAPEAVVTEQVPVKRLALGYQYGRARDQASNSVRMRGLGLSRVAGSALLRYLSGALRVLVSPLLGSKHFAKAVFEFGIGTGRLRGAMGRQSQHYAPGTEGVHTEGGSPK